MLADLFKEFMLELVRCFVFEGLCRRVRQGFRTMHHQRRLARRLALRQRLQQVQRRRLLHRITTDSESPS